MLNNHLSVMPLKNGIQESLDTGLRWYDIIADINDFRSMRKLLD